MAELPYMPIAVEGALADARELTAEEFGALMCIRLVFWRSGGTPVAEDKVMRWSGARRRWGAIKKTVMDRLYVADGYVSCPVTSLMLAEARRRRARAQDAAINRWRSSRVAEALLNGTADERLKSRKPLIPLEGRRHLAQTAQPSGTSNHNHNLSDSRVLSPGIPTEADIRREQAALYVDGVALLMRKTGIRRTQALRNVNDWLAKCGGDVETVCTLIDWADQENFDGISFSAMILKRAERIEVEQTKGLALPFGPAKRSIGGGKR